MGQFAIYTAFHVTIFFIFKNAAAFITEAIQRTVTEKAAELVIGRLFMAREVFAFAYLKEFTIFFHEQSVPPFRRVVEQRVYYRRRDVAPAFLALCHNVRDPEAEYHFFRFDDIHKAYGDGYDHGRVKGAFAY